MSICRFSSDGFASDLYVYVSERGVEVHVAANRLILAETLPPLPDLNDGPEDLLPLRVADWLKTHKVRREMLDAADREAIGIPDAGTSHTFESGLDAAEFIEELARLGVRVPDTVIPALLEEDRVERSATGAS